MSAKAITTNKAPAAIGPYSQAVETGGFLFISGQIPINPETGVLVADDVSKQAHQVFRNIGVILAEAGMSYKNVVKTTVILADMQDFATVNDIYANYFNTDPLPARAAFQAAALPKSAKLEVEVIASR